MNSTEKSRAPDPAEEKKERDRARIIEALRGRVPDGQGVGCFLCQWIVLDFEKNGKLTDFPYDSNNKGLFPYLGKIAHIRFEAPRLDVKVGVAV